MANGFFKIKKGVSIGTQASDPAAGAEGDVYTNSVTNRLKAYIAAAWRDSVFADLAQTLTNKTIDADSNTLSNIANSQIKTGAAIARAKLANGTADHVAINDGTGVLSSEAALSAVRGGTGVANNAAATLTRSGNHNLTLTTAGATSLTLPTAGTVATLDGTETFTSKTLTSPAINTPTIATAAMTGTTTIGGLTVNTLTIGTTGSTSDINIKPTGGSGALVGAAKLLSGDGNAKVAVSNELIDIRTSDSGSSLLIGCDGATSGVSLYTNGAASSISANSIDVNLTGSTAITLTAPTINLAGNVVGPIELAVGNSGTSKTLNFATAPAQAVTLTGNCTFTFTGAVSGTSYVIRLTQDATGSRTVTWPAAVKWPAATAPTLSTTAAKIDIISLYYNGTNYYAASSLGY